jgi:hypothetical protein
VVFCREFYFSHQGSVVLDDLLGKAWQDFKPKLNFESEKVIIPTLSLSDNVARNRLAEKPRDCRALATSPDNPRPCLCRLASWRQSISLIRSSDDIIRHPLNPRATALALVHTFLQGPNPAAELPKLGICQAIGLVGDIQLHVVPRVFGGRLLEGVLRPRCDRRSAGVQIGYSTNRISRGYSTNNVTVVCIRAQDLSRAHRAPNCEGGVAAKFHDGF